MIIVCRICFRGFVLLVLVGIFVLSVVETSSTSGTLLNPVPFFDIANKDIYTEIEERSLSRTLTKIKGSFDNLLKPRSKNEFVLVKTAYGIVRGKKELYLGNKNYVLQKFVFKFEGIPYAHPPIGLLRFKPPQPLLPWTTVQDALKMGSQCVQVGTANKVSGNEDCLFINVFTPALPEKGMPLKPTMVWIHGGGFKSGSGSIFGPDYLVPKDIVLVTFNYRLNFLGFFSLENDEISGNYGLKDQVQALKWVKENIANFGGDPDKVTIFGESAGGASVQFHLLSPLSKGLFHKAIIQSGSTLDPWAFTNTPKQNAINVAQFLGYNSSDDNELYNFFMNQSASSLAYASNTLLDREMNERNSHFSFLSPSVESEGSNDPFITKPPIEILLEGNFTKVPMIIGTLNGEGILVFSCVKVNDNYFQLMNNESTWAVPMNWEIGSERERDYIGQLVKKKYFNGKQISKDIVNDVVKFYTDTFFIIGTDQSITAYLNYSDAPIYNYEIIYEPLLSFIKAMTLKKQRRFMGFKGAAHADELSLFFPVKDITLIDSDQIVSDKLIKMWTNFAKTGNPNDPSLEVTWKKLKKGKRSYLEVSDTLKIKSGKVQQERMEFWESLCKSTSRKDKCLGMNQMSVTLC